MWRPDDVVAGHKRRAIALWMLLIFAIFAYSSWLFSAAVKKRDHPSTSLVLSNTVYAYPDMWLCLYKTYGCDTLELEEECLESSTMTDGGKASAVFYPGDKEYEQEVTAVGKFIENKGWCLEFKTSEVTAFLGQERNAEKYLDYFIMKASWFPGGSAGASTTCVPDGEKWTSHREWAYIFLHDPETNLTSTGIQISYSCITVESNSHVFTYMGIGLNEQRNIKKDDRVSYKALSLTSSVFKDEVNVNENVTNPYAYLEVQMQQEPDSWEIVTEIDPLNVGELLGSIGGFWDLILILWPIFFVAATRQDPHLKPRTFKKSVETVTAATGFGGVTARRQGPLKCTVTWADQSEHPVDDMEQPIEQPHWETTPPDSRPIQSPDDA